MKHIAVILLWLTTALFLVSTTNTVAQSDSKPEMVYTTVEQQPEFPGGKAALSRYLAQNIKFPNSLIRKNYSTGQVAAKFIVDRFGNVRDVRITTKPLEKETRKGMQEYMTGIIAAIEKMPRWRPGEVDGRPVSVFYTLPIEVNLQ
ncbi:energy transducer TonB [Spirosoma fluminis]